MTFDGVWPPAGLTGRPSPAINTPVIHTLLMAIQSTLDLEPEKCMRIMGGLQRSSSSK